MTWGHELTLEIHQSHPWFVVYDQKPDYLCIEPQTGPPDGVNAELLSPISMVTPGKPLSQQTAWSFIRAQPGG